MISRSARLCIEASKPECIVISWSVTLGSEVSQPECIAISRLGTLSTEASRFLCPLTLNGCLSMSVGCDIVCSVSVIG